jgi:transcription initiation factor TFIIH subunit 2
LQFLPVDFKKKHSQNSIMTDNTERMNIDGDDEIDDHVHGAGAAGGYTWEGTFKGDWTSLTDQSTGDILNDQQLKEQVRKRQRLQSMTPVTDSIVRKGVIRYMYLILDLSEGLLQPVAHDLKLPRTTLLYEAAKDFVREYFDQNPLSHMGLIVTRNGIAEKLLDQTGMVLLSNI